MKRDKEREKRAGLLTQKTSSNAISIAQALGNQTATRSGRGRPPGKRSNPDYQSVTTFLHKQTYIDVQRSLVGSGQDFGDVVDEMLQEWLRRQGGAE